MFKVNANVKKDIKIQKLGGANRGKLDPHVFLDII
jgi:hypothetical protein